MKVFQSPQQLQAQQPFTPSHQHTPPQPLDFFGATTNNNQQSTHSNGKIYKGEVVNGIPNGHGAFTFPNGYYQGGVKDGKFDGQGTLILLDGAEYTGGFKDGLYHGKGTLTYSDGKKYEGDFEDGIAAGKGILTYPSGLKYEGDFRNNRPNGKGTITCSDSSAKYESDFADGKSIGKGTITYSNGSTETFTAFDNPGVNSLLYQ